MTLTVLICVHSVNDFYDNLLIESLKSLESQTYQNFLTLIVLDECWDKTEKKIIDNFGLPFSIVKKIKKTGLASAKNYGLSHINTDLVAFLDADDLYLPTKLEKQIKFLTENNVDFLGTHALNITYDSSHTFDSCFNNNEFLNHESISKVINNQNVLVHGSMMIKKKCLDDLSGYNDVLGMEDWDLWKRAITKGFTFSQLSDRLYVYRINTSVKR